MAASQGCIIGAWHCQCPQGGSLGRPGSIRPVELPGVSLFQKLDAADLVAGYRVIEAC
jgi:hypothetical protein